MGVPIEIDEDKRVVFQIDNNRSLGPDGFNSKFYKLHRDLIKNDIWQTILGIHYSAVR